MVTNITSTENDIIVPSYYVGVSEMPHFPCTSCGQPLEINTGASNHYNQPHEKGSLLSVAGSATCRNCKAATGFEITNNVIAYVSGKSGYGSLATGITDDIKMLYGEAELCFRGGTPNACAAMCRTTIELALNEAECVGSDLFKLIKDAETKGKLGDIEVGLAHSSRLMARDAMHRGEFVSLADMPSMLSATVQILNKLSSGANPPA
ncbi:MAG: DUF4145 domain-containing protein [Dehalococcoidales bacterium]